MQRRIYRYEKRRISSSTSRILIISDDSNVKLWENIAIDDKDSIDSITMR